MLKILAYLDELNKRNVAHQLTAFAGQMAFFFVLSFFPMLIFTLSIISKLQINYDFMIDALKTILPYSISLLITDFISQTLNIEGNAVLSISGLTMLYASSKAVNALRRAINTSYEVKETRNYFLLKFMAMGYMVLFTIIIVLSLMIPTLAIDIVNFLAKIFALSVDKNFVLMIQYSRNILLISTFIIAIISIYTYLPNKKMHLKDIYPGALFAVFGLIVTNYLFSTVVVTVTDYSILYGSLSAMIAFMIWIYIFAQIIITGAEINALHVLKQNKEKSSSKVDNTPFGL
jgi:membrane protein